MAGGRNQGASTIPFFQTGELHPEKISKSVKIVAYLNRL